MSVSLIHLLLIVAPPNPSKKALRKLKKKKDAQRKSAMLGAETRKRNALALVSSTAKSSTAKSSTATVAEPPMKKAPPAMKAPTRTVDPDFKYGIRNNHTGEFIRLFVRNNN